MMSFLLVFVSLMTISAVARWGADAVCATPYCPPPWQGFQGHCYQFLDLHKSWLDAEKCCQMLSHPGKMVHLASILSEEEDDFIGSYVKSLKTADMGGAYWIGYHDRGRKGVYDWVDGTDAVYINWALGEPNNNSHGNEYCAEKYKQYASQKWNDVDCNSKRQFLCKM